MAFILLALLAQNPEDLKPGLVAEYRSLVDPTATVIRVDPKPAYALGDSSPHPRIPPGPFEVVWSGFILIQDVDAITFGGEATIDIDGRTVAGPVELKPGFHPIRVTSRAKRVQLTWEGKSFSREPIPPWKFRHAPVDLPEIRGRERVGKLGCARCHRDAFPGVQDPPPGPSLADLGKRVNAAWLMSHLDHAGPLTDAEKKTVAATLLRGGTPRAPDPAGDHRVGRRQF